MQNLPVILAVFVATAAIIAVLFWRIKPQAAPNTEALDKRIVEEIKRAETLQAKIDASEKLLREALVAASAANATTEAAKMQAASADANLKQTKNELAVLHSKYSEVEPHIATATEQKKAAENAQAEADHRYSELAASYAALQVEAKLLLERSTKAERDVARATGETEAVRQGASLSDARLNEATAKLNDLHLALSVAKSQVAETSAQREAAEDAKIDLEQRINILGSKHDFLTTEHKLAVERAATAESDAANTHIRNGEVLRAYDLIAQELAAAKRELIEAATKQQSSEDAARHFENISQTMLKEVLEEAKRGVGELAVTLQKASGEELSKHAEKVALTLEPLQVQLHAYDEAIKNFQSGSLESHISLKEQLSRLQETERDLGNQARALTTALSSTPKYKGTYGELALERLMEHAGLQEGPHYEKQARRNTEDGLKIPDMVVKMPGNQKVIVDAKAVMGAYVAAQETQDDTERNVFLKKHSENVRSRVIELSAKNYFADHTDAIDLVVLFLPAENLYVAAVENDHGLADFALSRNVIICGPSLLIMLLKSANQLWRRASIEEEAQKIKNCGDAIYEAACLFIQRYADLGSKIEQLEKAYNDAAGTLNGNLIPKGRGMGKFAAMTSNKEVKEIEPLKDGIKPFSSPEAKRLLMVTTEKLPGLSLGEFETAKLNLSLGDE